MLSHPLVIDAAESLFIPVCVYNNSKGDEDAGTLKAFREPAWNNPVVRIVDPRSRETLARVDGDYSLGGLAAALRSALEKTGREIPLWLRILAEEGAKARRERAVFGMG